MTPKRGPQKRAVPPTLRLAARPAICTEEQFRVRRVYTGHVGRHSGQFAHSRPSSMDSALAPPSPFWGHELRFPDAPQKLLPLTS